jgi:hypothetical protein
MWALDVLVDVEIEVETVGVDVFEHVGQFVDVIPAATDRLWHVHSVESRLPGFAADRLNCVECLVSEATIGTQALIIRLEDSSYSDSIGRTSCSMNWLTLFFYHSDLFSRFKCSHTFFNDIDDAFL